MERRTAKRAFITGITGQDGSYLAEFLLEKGYEVHGLVRRSSGGNTHRIEHLAQEEVGSPGGAGRLFLHLGDLTDAAGLRKIVARVDPDEVYNLASQSQVQLSFEQPEYTVMAGAIGTINILEAVRDTGMKAKFYQASSSEMFGKVAETPQTERTPFHPRSPYGCGKVYSHYQTVNYRESYGMFACSGILFDHESERRGEKFVTRKITRAVTRIKEGLQEKLHLGNIEPRRDWGHARDFVEAMWLMLQQDEPDDFVIATGESHSVREFLELVFAELKMNWRDHVVIDPRFFRPAEVELLQGDASKARHVLGWQPRIGFEELARRMTDFDLELARRERLDGTRHDASARRVPVAH